MWSDLPASVEHPGAPKGWAALLGDEGGKTALRGGTLDSRPQFRNGGSRVLAGARRLVVSGLKIPCALAAGDNSGQARGGVRRGEGDLSECGLPLSSGGSGCIPRFREGGDA